ncbi:PRC-barrel domain-containing protein [Roseovarius atlanticus]|uniref:PRC-barrel domain-containing protein n=1 Tax=Roseovarius atlanticus TaxID=1641875 RepID=UPI001C97BB11|nr:PRC-barrel domain-containing protein [Roseovarius atlanticus]MBY5987221.1 PRC-barrel domain-containing protein [Roseovarius atlanticus]MBY6125861.1 PRC-barrel domain-containing protein [Roseovarius atlanticus]MBY6149678.1 PRC-barrel domain-containing protein [Roseovarius atlanticus]
MYKTLTTSVAAIALMTGAAIAQSDTDAEGTLTTEQSVEAETQDTSEQLEQSAENTGEAVEDAAEDSAQAVENTAEDAAEGAEDMAEGAADATEDAADDVAESTDEAADDMTDSDVAADTETNAETESSDNMAADTEADTEMGADDGNAVTSTEGGMDSSFSGMLVGDILGQNVTTQAGEDVGEIDYIVRQGESLAAVIGIGGFLGLGEYTVAIPLEEFSMAPEGEGMMLSSWTEEELKAQPEFDETGVEGLEDDVPLDTAM